MLIVESRMKNNRGPNALGRLNTEIVGMVNNLGDSDGGKQLKNPSGRDQLSREASDVH